MTTQLSIAEVDALLKIQEELPIVDQLLRPTPSGAYCVTVTSFDVGRAVTAEDTRELVETLVGAARALEKL